MAVVKPGQSGMAPPNPTQPYAPAPPPPRARAATIPPSAVMQDQQALSQPPHPHSQMPPGQTTQQPSILPGVPGSQVPSAELPTGPIDASWQRIWLRAQGRDWVSLALIGSSPRAPEATMRVAGMLARISEELGHPLVVLDARSVELRTMASIQARMRSLAARGTRAITVLQYPHYNPISVPIAQAADASMLCVFIGESRSVNTEQTIEQIGRDRFLGTVILRHPG